MTATPITGDAEAIVLDYDLDESPEKVWRALTDPALVAKWLAPNDISTEVGRRFSLTPSPDAPVDCEVLEADPERRLSYRWREAGGNGPPLDSIVTFEITALPAGRSHLRLVHREAAAAGAVVSIAAPANDNLACSTWMSASSLLGSLSWAA
jgi:uncharacterized protein YndB with AHSA1/START domain